MDLKVKKFADLAASESSALIGKGASIKYVCTEGEGELGPKAYTVWGGCVNLVLQTWPKCVKRGRWSRIPKILRANLMDGP